MALKDNIVTPEVKANGYGAVDKDRLAKAIDQIAITYEFKNGKPSAADAFDALEGVSHAYGGATDTPAVEGLSIAIEQGEFAAVVGPSGCGKSTLMKLATGLQFPFKGSVAVAGQVVSKPVKIAGMAFQAPTLLPWRTTLENLLLPLEIVEPHRGRIRRHRGEYVARAEALLASVGLHDQGDKYPWELSGG